MRDFQTSMSRVGPSMQRGVQVEVETMQWEDIGGLEDVKKVWFDCVSPHALSESWAEHLFVVLIRNCARPLNGRSSIVLHLSGSG